MKINYVFLLKLYFTEEERYGFYINRMILRIHINVNVACVWLNVNNDGCK